MAQFTLHWNNTALLSNSNAIGQRVSYRQRRIGGSFITTGFTPTNDMAKSVTSADTPTLSDNTVYEFKVQTLCTVGGPIDNDNGLQEGINFVCVNPTITKTDKQSTIVIDVTNLDITKVRFTLRKSSDNSIVEGPVVETKVGNSVTHISTVLLIPSTSYYWQTELYANVNNTEVLSSDISYLGTVCPPYPFTTNAATSCASVTSIHVTSTEI